MEKEKEEILYKLGITINKHLFKKFTKHLLFNFIIYINI
jgi:hypothetical protein